MALFSRLYEKALQWAQHRYAAWYLAALSFAESSFFPIPPDVMLAPMVLARRALAWRYALITTVASVAGGALGYLIGLFAFEMVEEWLRQSHYWSAFQQAQAWFEEWGIWAIFIAGFSPVPYKIFTITAGVAGMAFLPFIIVSFIGRGMRFFLVAGLIWWGGERFEALLRCYVDRLGWGLVALILLSYVIFKVI